MPKKAYIKQIGKASRERRFATDFFMVVAYSLLAFAILTQVFLILWLEFI